MSLLCLVYCLIIKWRLRPPGLFNRPNAMHGILLTCEKHFHDLIITLRGKVCVHKTSLAPPTFIEVPVSSQESERSCGCVLGLSILELIRQCSIFSFSFYPMRKYMWNMWIILLRGWILFFLSVIGCCRWRRQESITNKNTSCTIYI